MEGTVNQCDEIITALLVEHPVPEDEFLGKPREYQSAILPDDEVAIETNKEPRIGCKGPLWRFRGGWRTGVAAGMITAFVVMLVNICVQSWGICQTPNS